MDGVYKDYCCGEVCQDDAFFRDENTVALQFGVDEFEICCGLKTKATIHKIFAVYFRIRNMPRKYASRLDNIYLAALCNSSNFKQNGCSEDDVFEELRRDLASLEKNGIQIDDNFHIKVGLFDFSGDNLGLKVSYGFAGSFCAWFYCRLCTCCKGETQMLTIENVSKRRSVAHYNSAIEKLRSNPDSDLKDTFGIRKNCVLNELEHYHVVSHPIIA